LSVTVSVTVYVPAAAYVVLGVAPASSAEPSPGFQLKVVMLPSGSPEAAPLKETGTPTTAEYGPPGRATGDWLPPPPDPAAKATWTFKRKQRLPVPIACNYHPWESAYILPLDHPYADISGADGTFRIANLPLGELQFQVWHERVGYVDTPQWNKGQFEMTIKPGVNDLGIIRLASAKFEKAATKGL